MKNIRTLRFLLIIIFIGFGSDVFSQENKAQEYVDLCFWIRHINAIQGDTVFATINGGRNQGIKVNTSAFVYGSIKNQNAERQNLEIGYAIVEEVFSDSSYATIIRYNATNPLSVINEFDYVKFTNISLPSSTYHSVFFELAKNNIHFIINDEDVFSLNSLLIHDTKQTEDSIINVLITNLKDIYELVAKKIEKDDTLYKPQIVGRYKGRSVMEVLAKAQEADIIAFVKYVQSYSISYTSNEWSFAQVFGTWAMWGAPYSIEELKDSINFFNNQPIEKKKLIARHAAILKSERMVHFWAVGSIDLIAAGKLKQAHKLLDLALEVGNELHDTEGLATACLYKAETYQNEEKYEDAIIYCEKSRTYYTQLKSNTGIFKTNIKQAYCLNVLKKYNEAIILLKNLITFFDEHKSEFQDYERYFSQQKIYYFLATAYYGNYDLNNALENYKKAIQVNLEENTLDSKKRNLSGYDMVATIYKEQGLYKEALPAYKDLLENYKALGNKEKVAATYNNIAYVQFGLSDLRGSIESYEKAFDIYFKLKEYSDAGFSKSGSAQAYYRLGKYDTAIALHKMAIEYRMKGNDSSGVAYSWNKLGSLYIQIGEKSNAIIALDSASFFYAYNHDSSSLYDVYLTYGDLYEKDKNYIKSYQQFQKAYDLSKKGNNTARIIESAFKIGNITLTYDTAVSRKYFDICNKTAKSIGDESNQIYSLLNLANLASQNFQFNDSKNMIDIALNIARKNGNIRDKAQCFKFMARIYNDEMNMEMSNDYYLRAIHIFDSLGEVTQLSYLYSCVGYNYVSKGDFFKAEKFYLKAKAVAEKNLNVLDKADALSMVSYVYSLQGDFNKALLVSDSAIALVNSLNNEMYLAMCYLNKGGIYQHTSDYKKANYYYGMADSIYRKENSLINLSTSQNNIGTLYFWQADYDGCYPYIKNAYDILEKINLRNEAWVLYSINLGEIFYAKKEYAKALKFLLPAYKISKDKKLTRMIASSSIVLGKVEYAQNNLAEALNYLKEANDKGKLSGESEKIIESSLYLGRVYMKMNNREKGIEYLNICVTASAKFNIVKYNWEALYDLGMIYFNAMQFDSSVYYFKQAIGIVEENSSKVFDDEKVRSKFVNDNRKVDLYYKTVEAFVGLHDTVNAIAYANRSSIQGIREKISEGGIFINDPKKSEAIEKAKQMHYQLQTAKDNLSKEKAKPAAEQNQEMVNSYERTILNVESNYQNYLDSLIELYPAMRDNFAKHANPEDFNVKNVPADVAVVLYIVNENNLLIFTVTNQKKNIQTIKIKQADLEAKLKTFVSLLNVPNKAEGAHTLKLRGNALIEDNPPKDGATLIGTSKDLYNILIAPVADDIKGKSKVCIIPNGKLCNIPFQVLGTNNKDGAFTFLLEDHSVFYLNKLDVFYKSSTGNDSIASIAAFGNPDFNNTQKNLPSAEKEVKEIQGILNAGDYYYGKQATEEQAKKSLVTKHFIHFATHGILDNARFKNSYIKFATDLNDDGNLTIKEINELDLSNCDLVVLSACETAVTNDSIKGWYYSAANAFLVKGTKTVIASLWSVDDNATGILMTEFYKNIMTMPKAEALRQAQAVLSKNPEYVHPFFWGAFVLYGDWR